MFFNIARSSEGIPGLVVHFPHTIIRRLKLLQNMMSGLGDSRLEISSELQSLDYKLK